MQNNEFQNRRDFLKLGAKVASSVATSTKTLYNAYPRDD